MYEKLSNTFTYEREKDLEKYEKSHLWNVSIGLQAVDGLETSKYLKDVAQSHIEGNYTIEEACSQLAQYYEAKRLRKEHTDEQCEEADKVSLRIHELLSETTAFFFSPSTLLNIHAVLFQDVFSHAGKVRDYNITKKEWVLNGESVRYASCKRLRETLDYDFAREKEFSYRGLDQSEIVRHMARFIANIWQIHPFCEGNTRTTAVFLIQYLRFLGFSVTNDSFASHSWYFRNALVRANYTNLQTGVYETTEYLELFLWNLMYDKHFPLDSRTLHI